MATQNGFVPFDNTENGFIDTRNGFGSPLNHRPTPEPHPGKHAEQDKSPSISDDERNAYNLVLGLLREYDLESLAPDVLKMVQQGYDQNSIGVMIQDTDAYKKRFAGNQQRIQNGLSVLSPADYINLENTYAQVLKQYGMPKGFYDQHSDFASLIGSNVSPQEVQERAQDAADAVYGSDPQYLEALRQQGVGDGDLIAYMLDEKRALPQIQQLVKASQIGAEAIRQGLTNDTSRNSYFASLGVTHEQAAQAYGQIGEMMPAAEQLSQIYGTDLTQEDLEDELLGQSGSAASKRKKLANRETGSFSGTGGASDRSFKKATRGEF